MDLHGTWQLLVTTPQGSGPSSLEIACSGAGFTATMSNAGGEPLTFTSGQVVAETFHAEERIKVGPVPMKIVLAGQAAEGEISGTVKFGLMGTVQFVGTR